MLNAFVITLREGLEAFLIVAIILAYLRKTNRANLVPAVHWGIVLSVVMSIIAATLRWNVHIVLSFSCPIEDNEANHTGR